LLEKDVDALDAQYRELKKELQTQQDMVLQIQSEKSQKDREVKNFQIEKHRIEDQILDKKDDIADREDELEEIREQGEERLK